MSEKFESTKKGNRMTIILVVVMFVSPLILSWYVFNYSDFIEMRGMSNKGDLIVPTKSIPDLALIDPFNAKRKDSLYGEWNLIYVDDFCEKICMDNIYLMRQVHASMNKHSLRVQKVLLLTDQLVGELKDNLVEFKGQQFIDVDLINIDVLLNKFRLNNADDPKNAGRIYIIDPRGNLMMSYAPNVNPKDVYKDLKKLLRGSRIG
jgi:hypothetical protein